jgi:hypothetical protein
VSAELATFLLSGGGIAAAITWLNDLLMTRRQENNAISTVRIQMIANAMPFYNQLAMNCWNFGWFLTEHQEKTDYHTVMYYLCNMLYLKDQITKKFGDVQLDSLKAEEILSKIWREIRELIIKRFGMVNVSKLTTLVTNDLPYYQFVDKISNENKELYDLFMSWISVEMNDHDLHVLKKCLWYTQLLMLESNHIYKSWYGEEPPLILRDDLRDYLNEHERNYYNRIRSFHLRATLQRR